MSLSLRRKILIGYSIAFVLLLGILLFAVSDLLRLGRASDAILSENYRSILAAEHMIGALERQDSGILLYLLGSRDAGIRQFRENQSQFLQWLGRAKDNVTIDGEDVLLTEIDSTYSEYLVEFARLLRDEASGSEPFGSPAVYSTRILPAFLPVRSRAARLRVMNEETMVAASARAQAVARRSIWSLAIVGVILVGAGLFVSLVGSDRLVRPVREVTAATSRLAAGDYEARVPEFGGEELGELARGFNEMADQLKQYRDLNVEQLMAEKRKSEALIRSVDDGLLVVDNELSVLDANPTALRIFGSNRDSLVGLHLLEVLRDEKLMEKVRQTVEAGPSSKQGEPYRLVMTDALQETRHFDVGVRSVQSEARELFGFVLIFRDVTRHAEIDRMKSEFVATASHELRTPLTSIAMSLDLIEENAGSKLQRPELQLLQGTRADVERLRALVRDLLDLARMEAGSIDLDSQEVEPSLICEKATEVMQPLAEEAGIELLLQLPAKLPRVLADVNKLTWVVTNLISNSLRYSKSSDRLEVSARQLGSSVHFSVRDHGRGIPYGLQSRIFDKFVQGDGESAAGGTGLGLAICREVVRAHRGSIWVESEPGEGSTFTFTLPVSRPVATSG